MRQTKWIGLCVLVLVLASFSAVPVNAYGFVNPRAYDDMVETPRMWRLLFYMYGPQTTTSVFYGDVLAFLSEGVTPETFVEPDWPINVFYIQEEPYFRVYGLVRGIGVIVEDMPNYTRRLNEKRAYLETTWLFNLDRLPSRSSFPH
jgi:hypothetical protein